MDDDLRARLDRLTGLVETVAGMVGRLEAEWERYRAILPEPGSIKEKVARRRVAAAALRSFGE